MGALGDIMGGLGGAAGGLWGMLQGDNGAGDAFKQAMKVFKDLDVPVYDMENLTPAQLKILAEYSPETYEAVVAAEPRYASEGPEGRQGQLTAMEYFDRVRQEGIPLEERLAVKDSQDAMAQANRQSQDAIMTNMRSRGAAGGGQEIAARMGAGQQQANLARGMGSDLAREALARRGQAAAEMGQLGGQIRGQDYNLSASNADVWNNFNQWVSAQQTAANQYAANSRQAAGDANVANRQRIGEANEIMDYQNRDRNQQYGNQMRGQTYQDQLARAQGMSGGYQGMGNYAAAKTEADINNAQQIGQGFGGAIGNAGDLAVGWGANGMAPKKPGGLNSY